MKSSRPLVALSMIVKDEAATIARTLASVRGFVDAWVVVDTGSTDETKRVVREAMGDVPGELVDAPFVDFATTRNHALDLVGARADFVLWLDADDELVGGDGLRAFLGAERARSGAEHDAYYLRVEMGFAFDSVRVLRAGSPFRFRGAVHEVLVRPDGRPPSLRVPGASIRHHAPPDGGARSRARWERDVGLLERALAADPGDARSAFYLANTLAWLDRVDEAVPAFERRIALGGWWEEVYHSAFEIAKLLARRRAPWPEVQHAYLRAFGVAPHRAEPLHAIAAHYDAARQHALCLLFAERAYRLPRPTGDRLWIDDEVYAWRSADLVGSSAYHCGAFALGEEAARKALAARPDDARLRTNLEFYVNRPRPAR